ncbi:MAG: hypothetical protein ACOWWR_18440 [Eubacteriales bacterium]
MIYKEAVNFIREECLGCVGCDDYDGLSTKYDEVIRLLKLGESNKRKVMELEGKIIELTKPPRGIVDMDCPGGVCPVR